MKATNTLFFVLLILSFFSCKKSPSDGDVGAGLELIPSDISGIDFINSLEDDPLTNRNVLSFQHFYNGAGVGVGDFNNDGLQDVFFAGNDVPNALFINKGDLKFERLPESSGINQNKFWSSGVCVVDINDDGFQDIYVCQQGPHTEENRRNLFYINNGDLTFTESAKDMGLDDPNYSTQATFFDFDKDGDLDCYVLNESKYAGVVLATIYEDLKDPENMRAASGKLFENTGNLKFIDVTEKAGVLKYGYGLGISVSDFNNDNWPDIYIANDYTVPDFLYINQQDGTFKESIKDYTRQISYFGMGCDVGDINNDGLVDIGVVDMAAEDHIRDKTLMAGMDTELFKYYFWNLEYQLQYMFNSLQINNGNNTFSNIAALSGVLKSDWSWSAHFVDLNLDGFKDFYVSNGNRKYARDNDSKVRIKKIRDQNNGSVPLHKKKDLYNQIPEIKLKNKLYINNKNLGFESNSTDFKNADIKSYSYGAAFADFDNDGDFDIVVNNIDEHAFLIKNTCRENLNRNYIKIKLSGIGSEVALNSKVYVYTSVGLQLQEYYFQRGYESSVEQVLLFGLDQQQVIDSIKVIWSDNNVQIVKNVDINQHYNLEYEKQTEFHADDQNKESYVHEITGEQIGVDFTHVENYFDDFENEILLPQKQTYFGPALCTGDINNDGLEDFYIGGAKGQSGKLYIQNTSGKFELLTDQPWEHESRSEDVDAVFIDPNQDGNMDLLVLSGGSGDFVGEEPLLLNRFYANTGNSGFARIKNVLPDSFTASYSVKAENIDGDPEKEILIIGAAQPGKYPLKEKSVILDYQNNKYVDVSSTLIPELNSLNGLIRDACWTDLNNDGNLDLITVGEWQNVEVFISENGVLNRKTKQWTQGDHLGWWRSIENADLDNDGDQDFIVGNVGKNFKQKASENHPLYLYSNDFDDNGTLDCVLAKDYKGKIVPARGRECSSEQMPFISDKFKTYHAFASASVGEILGEDKIEKGIKLKATEFSSCILWNEGNKLSFEKLPVLAQISPVNDILIEDINDDGLLDIIIVGNDYNTEYETPRLDAGNGLLLLNNGEGDFNSETISNSGIFCPGDAKKIKTLKLGSSKLYIVANNNDKPDYFIKT